MPRVIGIDPGTVSVDVCGLSSGRVDLDLTLPTEEALAEPERFVATLTAGGAPALIAGPSGYGLPLVRASEASEEDLRLAFLARSGEAGGIGGLRRFARLLATSGLPVVFKLYFLLGRVYVHVHARRVYIQEEYIEWE